MSLLSFSCFNTWTFFSLRKECPNKFHLDTFNTPFHCCYKSDREIQKGAGAAVLWNGHVQESTYHRHRRDLQWCCRSHWRSVILLLFQVFTRSFFYLLKFEWQKLLFGILLMTDCFIMTDFCEYRRTCFLREKYLWLRSFCEPGNILLHANESCFIVNCITLDIEISYSCKIYTMHM